MRGTDMTNLGFIDQNYVTLTDAELQEVDGGVGPLIIVGGVIVAVGLFGWGVYNGYQGASRGG